MASLHRFLILDDHADFCDMLCEVLRFRGHSCEAVQTRSAALLAIEVFDPDVVLFEWSLRTEAGTGLARELRARAGERGASLIILAISAASEPEGFRQKEQLDGYALKPIDATAIETLVAASNRVSSR
jgi:DNA-binding response OmpR family regulator